MFDDLFLHVVSSYHICKGFRKILITHQHLLLCFHGLDSVPQDLLRPLLTLCCGLYY